MEPWFTPLIVIPAAIVVTMALAIQLAFASAPFTGPSIALVPASLSDGGHT